MSHLPEYKPCRDKTDICDEGGECILCDAISGERCKRPDWVPSSEFIGHLSKLAESVKYVCQSCGNDTRTVPKVRALVWETNWFQVLNCRYAGMTIRDESDGSKPAKFCVFFDKSPLRDDGGRAVFHDNLADAKRVAQADHDKRILSALDR